MSNQSEQPQVERHHSKAQAFGATIALTGFLILLMATCLTAVLPESIYLPAMAVGFLELVLPLLVAFYWEVRNG